MRKRNRRAFARARRIVIRVARREQLTDQESSQLALACDLIGYVAKVWRLNSPSRRDLAAIGIDLPRRDA